MLTTGILSALGSAPHQRQRGGAGQSGDGGFGAMLSAELDNVGTLPTPDGGAGKGSVSPGAPPNEVAPVTDLVQFWLALAGADTSGSNDAQTPGQTNNFEASNNGEAEGYWTPERMQEAGSLMPSPTVDPGRHARHAPPLAGDGFGGVGAFPETEHTT